MTHHPLTLTLDYDCSPRRWVRWQQACAHVPRAQVAWAADLTRFTSFFAGTAE